MESFGAGTAAVISPVRGIIYKGEVRSYARARTQESQQLSDVFCNSRKHLFHIILRDCGALYSYDERI